MSLDEIQVTEKPPMLNLIIKFLVVIDYFTAWVNDEGIVNFRNDVYDKDKIFKEIPFSCWFYVNI